MNTHTFDKLAMARKIAVVTGGTQGLGEAIAHLFAERGAEGLVICGRNRANGERVKSALEKKGARAVYVEADLARVEDCRAVISGADKAFQRIKARSCKTCCSAKKQRKEKNPVSICSSF